MKSLAGAALVLLLTTGAAPQTRKSISLYVSAEQDGGLVQGLQAQNFRLYEDGKPQTFELEEPETPVSIALLLENSELSYSYYDDINLAVEGLLDAAPEGNWYALATFAHELHILTDFTKEIGRVRASFQDLPQPMWNDLDTYDAVYEMLDKMALLPGRRVLIVVASGFDSFSRHTLDDVQKKVEASDVTIFGVGLGSMLRGAYQPYLSDLQQSNVLMAQNFLQMLADESGGDAEFPNEEGAYPDVMKGVFQTLANQYRLVYSPQIIRDGKLHTIQVEAFQVINDKRKEFKVRARKGWRFE